MKRIKHIIKTNPYCQEIIASKSVPKKRMSDFLAYLKEQKDTKDDDLKKTLYLLELF